MHLCYVCSEYPPAPHGGIGSFTQTLARELVERGHRVTALGLYPHQHTVDREREVDQGVNVIRVSRRGLPLLRVWKNRRGFAAVLAELHSKTPVDVLEGGEIDLSVLDASAPGKKILRMHGGPTFFAVGSRIQVFKETRSFRLADHLSAVSHCVANGTREMLHLGNRHIEVIPNPIDLRLFHPARMEDQEDGLIVFAGTISERKGIVQLIQAMPMVLAQVPHARLEIYGGEVIDPAPKVPLKPVLQKMLPGNAGEHVIWKGRVPRSVLPEAIKRASVCVYPSHIEAMPIAWLEGLASAKAVVASKTGPGPELIDDGISGLLCDPHDPASIAHALIRVLKDRELRQSLGENARRTAEERYALPKIVERNETYYRAVVEGRVQT